MLGQRRSGDAAPEATIPDDDAATRRPRKAPQTAAPAAVPTPHAPSNGARAKTPDQQDGARLIVDEGPPQAGQTLASVFREQASTAIRRAVDARLGPTAMFGAPAVDWILAALMTPGRDLEATVRDVALAARRATTVDALLDGLLSEVHECLDHGGDASQAGRSASVDGIPDRRDGGGDAAERIDGARPGSLDALPSTMRAWLPDAEQVLARLDEVIAVASWPDLRPSVRAVAGARAGSRHRAEQRREGEIPDLEGVGSVMSVDEVVAGIRALQSGWPRMPAKERMEQILAVANRALVAADVPPAKDATWSPKHAPASFPFHLWHLWLSPTLIDKTDGLPPAGNDGDLKARPADGKPLPDSEAADLAATTAHEARHGEQWFLAARFAAAKGMDAAEIKAKQGIDEEIAALAHTRKLDGVSPQTRKLAEEMFDATITNKKSNGIKGNDYGYDELAARRADAIAAGAALRALRTPAALSAAQAALDALQAATDAVIEKYVTYRDIPYETDAHEVDAAAELAFEVSR